MVLYIRLAWGWTLLVSTDRVMRRPFGCGASDCTWFHVFLCFCFTSFFKPPARNQQAKNNLYEKNNLFLSLVSSVMIVAMLICSPLQAMAQTSANRANLLQAGSPVVLSVEELYNGSSEQGSINAVVKSDVYSADGSQVLIKAGTSATINYNAEPNGAWGKAGKIYLTSASTRTTNGQLIALKLNDTKKGGGKIGGVVAISVLFFPLGLLSGFMKGGMPKIQPGTTFTGKTTQDIVVE